MDRRPHGFSSVGVGLTISGGGEWGWAHDKKDSARVVLIRAARICSTRGPFFRAPCDSFPPGNRELFSGGMRHTLEGNRRRVYNDIIMT